MVERDHGPPAAAPTYADAAVGLARGSPTNTGAARAAAIDVQLFRICYIGGWKSTSAAVHDYIDATCPDTPAARRFFGWLLRS